MDAFDRQVARIGRVIRNRRVEAGYSQAEFAHVANVFRTHFGNIERGSTNPSLKVLVQIAQALGLSTTQLFVLADGEEGEAEPQSTPSTRKRGK
jgi:XRE family transcriptional regulator, regulator of sulfur utilization